MDITHTYLYKNTCTNPRFIKNVKFIVDINILTCQLSEIVPVIIMLLIRKGPLDQENKLFFKSMKLL